MASPVSFNEHSLSKYLPSARGGAGLRGAKVNKQVEVVSAFWGGGGGGGDLTNRNYRTQATHTTYRSRGEP